MIETANIESTAEAIDEGRKNPRRGGSKVSPSKRAAGGGIMPRPATTASRKGTRNGAIA